MVEKAIEIAVKLIAEFEGLKLEPYQCSADVWTIGYGTTKLPSGEKVHENTPPITKEEAEDMLQMDTERFCESVLQLVDVELNENQLAALTSFCYNLGASALEGSTLLSKLNQKDYDGAAEQFEEWVYADRRVLRGLQRRRKAERKLFEKVVD